MSGALVAKTLDQSESEGLFSEGLWYSKRTHLILGTNFWCRKWPKTMGNSMSHCIKTTDINYSLVHSAAQNQSEIFGSE